MIFFADENFSPRAAQLLEVFDPKHEVRALRNHFDPGTPDVDWIREISSWSPPPVVLAGDGRILKNKVELMVLRRANLSFVLLAGGWSNLPWETQAWKLVKVWPDIVRNVSTIRTPTVFEVSAGSGKVRRVSETRTL